MTAKEQQDLFTDLGIVHPGWVPRFRSGFVHGAADEGEYRKPKAEYLEAVADREADVSTSQYALGYLTGFAVYRGADAAFEPWFSFVDRLVAETEV
jgi:hypothetical protein